MSTPPLLLPVSSAARARGYALVFALGLVASAVSCSEDKPAEVAGDSCAVGARQACFGPNECLGTQSCMGEEFSPCVCEAVAVPAASSNGGAVGDDPEGGRLPTLQGQGGGAGLDDTGAAGSPPLEADAGGVEPPADAGVGPQNQIPQGVGVPCSADVDCPSTLAGERLLTCITSASNTVFGGGGPQGGYCSLPCNDSADCQAVDNLAACATLPNGGVCIAACTLGAGAFKCGSDRAQACFQTSAEETVIGACIPICTSDAACGPGRFCDPGLGLCVDTAPTGGGVGAPCTFETEAQDCASGICLVFSTPEGADAGSFCSASCTLGRTSGCGFDEQTTGAREAGCLQASVAGGAPGDLGFCFELCDIDVDCTQGDWVCEPFANAELQELLGRAGDCVPAILASVDE